MDTGAVNRKEPMESYHIGTDDSIRFFCLTRSDRDSKTAHPAAKPIHPYFAAGSVKVNVLPCPSPADSAHRCPPWASMRARAIVNPMPLPPPARRERDLSTR